MLARGLRWRTDAGKFPGGISQQSKFAVAFTGSGRKIRIDATRPEFRRRDRRGYQRHPAALSFANPAGADLDFAGDCDLGIGLSIV